MPPSLSASSSFPKVAALIKDLEAEVNPEKRDFYPKFFKTGRGEYGEGDKFLGITVPSIKKVIRAYRNLSLPGLQELLYNPYHEVRLASLVYSCLPVSAKECKQKGDL